ncbi:MAG TPA: IPT/TIG domain-containing protein, partial [Bryobacteraceae bacterium]|nr:IPT/TIG domain-containing protein [Bryobacteraceae bacterium]
PERINSGNSATLDAAAAAYNQAMIGAIATLKAAHPGITIAAVDSYALFTSIGKNPGLFGFTNIASGAQGVAGANPNNYLFWDTLHPTTVGHAYVANIAYSAVLAALGGPAYSCSNAAAPAITSVQSASAYGGYAYFTSGSWLEIKGTNLADPTDPRLSAAVHPGEWTSVDFTGANAPTSLDGISVSINGKPAYVWYLSRGQLNVQAPEDATLGNVNITVTNCKTTSTSFALPRQALAPGLLAPPNYSSSGTQYVVATFTDGTYVLNTGLGASFGLASRPAKPGDTIIFYGVGFGDVNPAILPGVVVGQGNQLANTVAFSFGSTAAGTPAYQGLAGNFVGLYEFYVTVPSGLANGDYQIHVAQNGAELPQKFYLTVQN